MKLGPLRQNARFRIKNVCTPDFAPGAIKLAAHVASHGADPMLLPFGRGAAWKEALRSAAVLSSVALDILKKVAAVGRAGSHAALSLRVKLFIITRFFQNPVLLGIIFDLFERKGVWRVWNTWLT